MRAATSPLQTYGFGKAKQYLMSPNKAVNPIWRRNVLAWCCYDWANSGYTTLLITVFAVYMQRVVFSTATSGATGAVVWAWSVAISMLMGALDPQVFASSPATPMLWVRWYFFIDRLPKITTIF